MSLTLGPNVVLVTAAAANFGFRRVIPHMIGITLGFGALVMGVGIGLTGLFQAEPRLHMALKYAGAAYLLYLAWRIAQSDGGPTAAARSRPIGFVVLWAAFGTGIGRLLATPRARKIFNWSMAGLLVLSLVPVFWPSPAEAVGALLFLLARRPLA